MAKTWPDDAAQRQGWIGSGRVRRWQEEESLVQAVQPESSIAEFRREPGPVQGVAERSRDHRAFVQRSGETAGLIGVLGLGARAT